ncbi:unnamed protein product, partial [Staurois parvus]
SWGPWAIGVNGAPVSLPKLKIDYQKGTRGISWCPLLTPGPRAVPEFPNGQSAPGYDQHRDNQRCPDRGAERKLLLQALASAVLDTDRSHKTVLTADGKR